MALKLFSFFHLNLAYSAIEEEQRKIVIERCYWPLLRLAKEQQLPFGIEASAWTLETIDRIDTKWITAFRDLVTDGPCEFIGCGYAQVIGPLVPARINAENLRLGMQHYERLLDIRPSIGLVNEQAYSSGLVPIYKEAGYEALIMEWNNPACAHSEWDSEWRYLPQYACGPKGETLPLIWNKSISFQKFQRYVHGEIELDEYLEYIQSHIGTKDRVFPMYGNDVEVFDFRPGRYTVEAPLHGDGEWQRISVMYAAIQQSQYMEYISPSAVLDLMKQSGAGNHLHLATAAQPVPVKKQGKYNLLRWAVTGRDDIGINTRCWRIFDVMQTSGNVKDTDWAEILYLWSSDFRTHITESRWQKYLFQLGKFEKRWKHIKTNSLPAEISSTITQKPETGVLVQRIGRFVEIKGKRFSVRLNCQRGLALESLIDFEKSAKPLCGTLHHGYYDNIQWGADYYSGHLVFESPGKPKVTDLNVVDPQIYRVKGGVCVCASIPTLLGFVEKRWYVYDFSGRIVLSYRIHWNNIGAGSLRLGHITLNPEAFEKDSLRYGVHNGGAEFEPFPLKRTDFDHGRPVSSLISANQAVGLTEGIIETGDKNCALQLKVDKTQTAVVGLVSHRQILDKYFCRLCFSVQELDDTCRGKGVGPISLDIQIKSL